MGADHGDTGQMFLIDTVIYKCTADQISASRTHIIREILTRYVNHLNYKSRIFLDLIRISENILEPLEQWRRLADRTFVIRHCIASGVDRGPLSPMTDCLAITIRFVSSLISLIRTNCPSLKFSQLLSN